MSTVGATKSLSIDFDSVLADTMIAWTMEYNKLKHTNITKNEITYWDIGMILPLSAEEISKIFNYVWQHCWQEIPPSEPGQSEIIKRIHRRGYRISILTKRERSTAAYVAKWLDYHDIYSDDLIFLYDNTPKSEYPFDILIDDVPSNLIDITSPKIGILFNQPWNKDFNWPLRVNTLSEAEQVIL
jgi:5'(3')-deoxyribonucleotidase